MNDFSIEMCLNNNKDFLLYPLCNIATIGSLTACFHMTAGRVNHHFWLNQSFCVDHALRWCRVVMGHPHNNEKSSILLLMLVARGPRPIPNHSILVSLYSFPCKRMQLLF